MTHIDPIHALAALDLYDAALIHPSEERRTEIFDAYRIAGMVVTGELLAGALSALSCAVKTLAVKTGEPETDVVELLRLGFLAARDAAEDRP